MLTPDRVSVPVPALVRPPCETTPARVTSEAVVSVRSPPPRSKEPPKVSAPARVASPRVKSVFATTSLTNERSVLPSLETVPPLSVRVPAPKALSPPARRAPAFRVRPPEKLLAPPRVRAPAPFLIRLPFETVPAKDTSATVVTVRVAPPRSVAPVKVSAASSATLPNVKSPPKRTALPKVRAVEPMPVRLPPTRRSWPLGPKAALSPTRSTPALMEVYPV